MYICMYICVVCVRIYMYVCIYVGYLLSHTHIRTYIHIQCASCVNKIETYLKKNPFISEASVSLVLKQAKVVYDSSNISSTEIVKMVKDLVYETEVAANKRQVSIIYIYVCVYMCVCVFVCVMCCVCLCVPLNLIMFSYMCCMYVYVYVCVCRTQKKLQPQNRDI